MTNVELWMKGVEERRKEEAEPSPAKIHKGLENRHRYAKVTCETSDGRKVVFPYIELRQKIDGNIGIGRRFMLDDEVYKIVKKEIPSRHMPNTDGNYKHTSFEYRMAKTSKGKI